MPLLLIAAIIILIFGTTFLSLWETFIYCFAGLPMLTVHMHACDRLYIRCDNIRKQHKKFHFPSRDRWYTNEYPWPLDLHTHTSHYNYAYKQIQFTSLNSPEASATSCRSNWKCIWGIVSEWDQIHNNYWKRLANRQDWEACTTWRLYSATWHGWPVHVIEMTLTLTKMASPERQVRVRVWLSIQSTWS